MQAVDVNSLEWVRPRSVAVEPIGLWAMRQVSFVELLIESGISEPLRAAILGALLDAWRHQVQNWRHTAG